MKKWIAGEECHSGIVVMGPDAEGRYVIDIGDKEAVYTLVHESNMKPKKTPEEQTRDAAINEAHDMIIDCVNLKDALGMLYDKGMLTSSDTVLTLEKFDTMFKNHDAGFVYYTEAAKIREVLVEKGFIKKTARK